MDQQPRILNEHSRQKFRLPKSEPLCADKTLFVNGVPEAFPSDMAAVHVLRAAVASGCAKISITKGRWSHEFDVKDLLRKVYWRVPGTLGPSSLERVLAGDEFDETRGPLWYVRPPWNQGV